MSQQPTTPPPGGNQTTLELIYAIRGLAQALDFMHTDLRRLVEEEARDREEELEKIREVLAKNQQTLSVLPITISDRMENLVRRMDESVNRKVDGILKDVQMSLDDVRNKLWLYLKDQGDLHTELAALGGAVLSKPDKKEEDVTGKVELHKGGKIAISFQTGWIKKAVTIVKWGVVFLAAGGGVAGIVAVIKAILHGIFK